MMWISDISIYRCRLNKMLRHLQSLKTKFSLEGRYDSYISISQKFQAAQNKLQVIENKIIHTINKKLNELYKPTRNTWSLIENEAELFEYMITANSMIIELQRSLYNGFQTPKPAEIATTEHSSKIVSMPDPKKLKVNNRG